MLIVVAGISYDGHKPGINYNYLTADYVELSN
jgi:hypothetical protein